MKTYIEQDCTIEHEGHKFTPMGAIVTDELIIAYMSSDMSKITDWHGEELFTRVHVSSSWRINSFMSDKMYQVYATINGKSYTGRTMGGGMIVRLKICK